MKFNEIPLYRAIAAFYIEAERPRSDAWTTERFRDLYINIVKNLDDFTHGVPWTAEQVRIAWSTYGKSPMMQDAGISKCALTIATAEAYGPQCFYAGRVDSECNNEVEVDRIVPGTRGGMYIPGNCMLACGRHNSSRGDKTIEEFIGSH